MQTFKPNWEEWIDHNLRLNNCKKIMFQKSLEAGYSYDLLHRKLGIDYIVAPNNTTNTERVALRTAHKLNARNLDIYTIDDFLTKEECDKIIQDINSSELSTSKTYSATKPKESYVSESRTSQTCYFLGENSLIAAIESRICKTVGINNRFTEKIQGQKYLVWQEFKRHTDYFDPVVLKDNPSIKGQRTWTCMIYLNDVEEGGYTSFPYAFVSTKPKTGMAVIWNNLDGARKENIFSTHHGMPILKGEKYILTKWFKEREINLNIRNELCDHHYLPIFHPVGFEKISLRLPCIDAIKQWMMEHSDEFVNEIVKNIDLETNMRSKYLDITKAPKEIVSELQNEFQTILTRWIGYKAELSHVATYGIRDYLRGSILENHYDKINIHVISAIIHLDDTSDKPWELYIEDHSFRPHQITMKYGDVVLYESTTCLHGRPTPFEGESHRNMYIHFKPEKW